ncbi:MAG: hypothetical protein ACRC3Y_17410 [Romboutsia sp.]|uniref:hypothetical protein n=1 Tax=Romboutsia sp. TaxID=1965302 RepID=UPI003F31067C
MNNSKIYFNIININKEEKTIDINLKIDNISNVTDMMIYKGNTKLVKIISENEFKEGAQYIKIKNIKEIVDINYTVKIGCLGKHGQSGDVNENLITFSGDNILMLPIEVLRANDIELNKLVNEIIIDYGEELNKKDLIIPCEVTINNKKATLCRNPKWHNIYELMKSCYAFGEFENIQNDNEKEHVKILINNENIYSEFKSYDENIYDNKSKVLKEKHNEEGNSKKTIITNEKITEEINKLCSYYEELFDYKIENLNIILLDKNQDNNEYILGGAGRNIIGATFDKNNLRDWQLLSHRLFHAYMDNKITIRQMHMAPQLWITEGLATYHENLALENLDRNLKVKLNIDFNKEIKKIYRRYLYLRLKDVNTLSIAPMEEDSINSHGKIEFLHYTQAPLIIKMIEDISNKFGQSNAFIKYLRNTSESSFNIKSMFDYTLRNQCDEFAYKYLFNSSLIELLNLETCNNESEEVIIQELNEYEYLLWSWFVREDELYSKEVINGNKLDTLSNTANMVNLRFEDVLVEQRVSEFSNVIYKLLKAYLLRIKICKVSLMDKRLRYNLYENEVNIKKWEFYIDSLN